MHIKEAIRILTTELARRSGISIVRDDLYKKELIEKSSYFHQFSNPIVIDYSYHNTMSHINKNDSKSIIQGWYFSNNKNYIETNVVYSDLGKLIEDIEFCKGANYFFVDNPLQDTSEETPKSLKGFHIFVTPYSIIGKDEITNLKEIFYKYAPAKILSAMDSLNIDNYIDIYEQYSNQDFSKINLNNRCIYKFLNLISDINYDNANEISDTKFSKIGGIDLINSELQKLGIKSKLNGKSGRNKKNINKYPYDIHRYCILQITDEIEQKYGSDLKQPILLDFSIEFSNFIFTLPYENQKIETNKLLLHLNASSMDYLSILDREYTKGRHFEEYFDCLELAEQEAFVKCLKAEGQEGNIVHDSFLWSKGFKGINRNYMDLYKKDADEFIEYFKSKKQDDKKTILKDIMDCDYTNKTATKWLHENEIELLREVSMDG